MMTQIPRVTIAIRTGRVVILGRRCLAGAFGARLWGGRPGPVSVRKYRDLFFQGGKGCCGFIYLENIVSSVRRSVVAGRKENGFRVIGVPAPRA